MRRLLLGTASVKRWSGPGGFGAPACPRSGGAAGTAPPHPLATAPAKRCSGFVLATVVFPTERAAPGSRFWRAYDMLTAIKMVKSLS